MRPIWIDNLIRPPRDWQTHLIHHNLLAIGHSAWEGYLRSGVGLVVCQLTAPLPASVDWGMEPLPLSLSFVPEAQAADLQLEPAAVPGLLETIATYDPSRALILLVYGNDEAHLSLLQDLAISPPDCYEQVCRRWDEFAS